MKIKIEQEGPDEYAYRRNKYGDVEVYENGRWWWTMTPRLFKAEFGIDVERVLEDDRRDRDASI